MASEFSLIWCILITTMKVSFRKRIIIGCVIAIAACCAAIAIFIAVSNRPKPLQIPRIVADKLLFTPYMPSRLPHGYSINRGSFIIKEGALLFAASNGSQQITFSEQAVPKNFDVNTFYETSLKEPLRLHGTIYSAVYGQKHQENGTITGVTTTDNTWIVLSTSENISKENIKILINSLHQQ